MAMSFAKTMCRPTGPSKGPMPFASAPRARQVISRTSMPDMNDPATREAYEKAMKDPAFQERLKAMQQEMAKPEVQQQMAQMQQFLGNQQVQERLKSLKDDPEFKDMFDDLAKNGMGALMKYMNDEKVLAAFSRKIGDVVPGGAPAAAAATGVPPPGAPEINTLYDASRYGDIEAVEDFISIGKDVNEADKEGRTPLHVACAYAHSEIAKMLLEAGASLEAVDSKQNTPLHYSAGYGRPALVSILLDAGADKTAKNGTGKTPLELIKAAPQNPINTMPEILERL